MKLLVYNNIQYIVVESKYEIQKLISLGSIAYFDYKSMRSDEVALFTQDKYLRYKSMMCNFVKFVKKDTLPTDCILNFSEVSGIIHKILGIISNNRCIIINNKVYTEYLAGSHYSGGILVRDSNGCIEEIPFTDIRSIESGNISSIPIRENKEADCYTELLLNSDNLGISYYNIKYKYKFSSIKELYSFVSNYSYGSKDSIIQVSKVFLLNTNVGYTWTYIKEGEDAVAKVNKIYGGESFLISKGKSRGSVIPYSPIYNICFSKQYELLERIREGYTQNFDTYAYCILSMAKENGILNITEEHIKYLFVNTLAKYERYSYRLQLDVMIKVLIMFFNLFFSNMADEKLKVILKNIKKNND